MQMARQLISSMSSDWKPEEYTDEYHDALEKLIEEKIEHPDHALPKAAKRREVTNVIDLVSVLQKSLQQTKSGAAARGAKKRNAPKSRHPARKKAA
jgi:DNA end-binding protein Ku